MKKLSYQEMGQKIDGVNRLMNDYQNLFNELGTAVQNKENFQPLFEKISTKAQIIQEKIVDIKDLELRNVDKPNHQKWVTEAKDYLDSVYEHTFLAMKLQEHQGLGFFKRIWKAKEIVGVQQRLQEVSQECMVKGQKYNKSVNHAFHRR